MCMIQLSPERRLRFIGLIATKSQLYTTMARVTTAVSYFRLIFVKIQYKYTDIMFKSTLFHFAMAAMCVTSASAVDLGDLRAPAYPLVTIDTYANGWSTADNLYDEEVKHWTETPSPLIGVAVVDGKPYRFMGKELPVLSRLLADASAGAWSGRYTTSRPDGEWFLRRYDDSAWNVGDGAFGTMPAEPLANTVWDTPSIWVRRTFDLPEAAKGKPLFLKYSHDDDVTIYVNGIKVVDTGNACYKNVSIQLPDEVIASLTDEGNVIAAHCHDRGGLAFLDFGIDYEVSKSTMFSDTARQVRAEVWPMNTVYEFVCGDVDLTVRFTAPVFLDDLELVSRPVNYLTYEVRSRDGGKHDVKIYFEAGREWAVENVSQNSVSEIVGGVDGLAVVSTANALQKPLNKAGDHIRIDWGTFYLAAPDRNCAPFACDGLTARRNFLAGTAIPEQSGHEIGLTVDLGRVKKQSGYIMLGYDDGMSIQYFGQNLRPYWNRNNDTDIIQQLRLAEKEYGSLMSKSVKFDRKLVREAAEAGGDEYAALCALAYRQAIAAHKLVESPSGEILWFSKENDSNGSIGTVDITYPSAPMFLVYNPDLVKGMMNHIFEYSESGRWQKPFPSHDVGTYPLANGQTYGGDMPVEEGGNMLCLTAAIAAVEGNASYAAKHWDTLTTWTDYLVEYGLDPENQLCTDDFAGHFAHNANLSVKAILGIASYAYLAEKLDKPEVAGKYYDIARTMASEWEKMAYDGDHYRLTFDKPGTWSQKYNLLWDKLLGLNIFPQRIIDTEIPYYLTKQNIYGLPLDNRETYTKTDWIVWTATLAPDKETFMQFISPVYKFMDETRNRVPMSDWVFTDKPERRGFKARSVVGGYYTKLLERKLKHGVAASSR